MVFLQCGDVLFTVRKDIIHLRVFQKTRPNIYSLF